ncbi:MFS transporter [Leucobacter weissii]|uniref:MFS transporter n=1 Tax=Leucobacter weissii TaxID=1983706 RepID=A0A939MGF5_9MICO|nr:MFS transporter [Leucobacter weissii]
MLFCAVCLVAINLRMTITGVGPLLDQIAVDQGVSPAALGALGSVPLLAWALVSPLTHGLNARFGLSRAMSWSLVVLAIGTIWRSLPGGPAHLWIGTALIGVGLAITNVLMPAAIKRFFPERVPLVTGAYTAVLGAAGAAAAGAVVPLSQLPTDDGALGWRAALLMTGAFLPLALVVWILATSDHGIPPRRAALERERSEDPLARPATPIPSPLRGAASAGRRMWGDPLAWLVSLYMGAQSSVFYMLSTWLPAYEVAQGRSAVVAGVDLMVFQLVGIAGSLLIPLLGRSGLRRWLPAILPMVGIVAWIGMLLAPVAMPAWVVIGGLAGGGSFTMSLTLMAVRARSEEHASALSGMAQTLGYSIAALGPIAFGWTHDLSGGWTLPFALLWVAACAQLIIGLFVGRPRFVLDRGVDA